MIEASRGLARDMIVGFTAAFRSPSRIQSDLSALLAWPETDASRSLLEARVERSVRAAHRALRYLSRIPGNRWRNTCLYRSVAECDVRREYGGVARIVIGVDRVEGDVVAHSWVERAGVHATDARAMAPLHAARPAAVAG